MRAHNRITLALLGKPEFRGREIEAVLFALDHPDLSITQIQEIFRNGTDDAWNAEWKEVQRLISTIPPDLQQNFTALAHSSETEC